MPHNVPLYAEWILKAQDDELSLQAVLNSGAPSTACFLAQQMAEKYLKALLVFKQQNFPKVHDLLNLETRLLNIVSDISTIHSHLQTLNRYYIETRYPGDYPAFTKAEASAAQNAAVAVKNYVLTTIYD